MALETELAAYEAMKAQLLASYENKFVLIRGGKLIGSFDTAENAYNAGIEAFGQEIFLVKKVTRNEPPFAKTLWADFQDQNLIS